MQRYKLLRGGSWDDLLDFCRSAARFKGHPVIRVNAIGFRVVLKRKRDAGT